MMQFRVLVRLIWSKRTLFILFLLLFGGQVYAQKEAYNWYFGQGAGIKFAEDSTVTVLLDGKTNSIGSSASISDKDGNLLFYTDGNFVFNKNHVQMPNGDDIRGEYNFVGRSSIIVPNPRNPDIYYIFCATSLDARWEGFSYSIVDLSEQGGLGDVIVKYKLLPLPVGEVITATLHQNGKDIWVVTCQVETNNFLAYLVTSAGVNETPVVSSIGEKFSRYGTHQMKISPDGLTIAVTCEQYETYTHSLEALRFNPASGQVTNTIFSINNYYPYIYSLRNLTGVEFSPNNRFLYSTNQDSQGSDNIYQFDLEAGSAEDIRNSIMIIGTPYYGIEMCMQLGPDGMIYIAHGGGGNWDYLSRIEKPNLKGVDCKHEQIKINLEGRDALIYLPTFISSYFNAPSSIEVSPVCLSSPVSFQPSSLGLYDSLVWDFNDPKSGLSNRSTEKKPTHTFTAADDYHVTLTTFYAGVAKEISYDVELKALPVLELGNDRISCEGTPVTLAVDDGYTYAWSTGATTNSITVTKAGKYKVTVSNGQCEKSDSLQITMLTVPIIDFPDVVTSCAPALVLDAQNAGFTKSWSTGESVDAITVTQSGKYSVKVNNQICINEDTVEVRFVGITGLQAHVSMDTLGFEELAKFTANLSNIDHLLHWDFGDGSSSSEKSPTHLYENEGSYTISVTEANQYGCKASTTLQVVVNPYLFIPNVFTPNNDGKNDAFAILYNGENPYSLNIFSRWGELVYHSDNKKDVWDGRGAASGVYYFQLKLPNKSYKGWVHLLR